MLLCYYVMGCLIGKTTHVTVLLCYCVTASTKIWTFGLTKKIDEQIDED